MIEISRHTSKAVNNTTFSKSIIELAKSIQCRVKFDDILSNIIDLEKAEKMSNYLNNAGLCSGLWDMRVTIIMIELMNQGICDDETALNYIGKLHVGQ
jgi:hypothetical protein